MEPTTTLEPGCYLDNHRGHYITRDMIDFATEHGYIVGEMDAYVLSLYEDHYTDENYPHEILDEIARDAEDWLNVGENSGVDRPIRGQNNPPAIPENHAWAWQDGDFGLYPLEDD